jgi:hypothetical protein
MRKPWPALLLLLGACTSPTAPPGPEEPARDARPWIPMEEVSLGA